MTAGADLARALAAAEQDHHAQLIGILDAMEPLDTLVAAPTFPVRNGVVTGALVPLPTAGPRLVSYNSMMAAQSTQLSLRPRQAYGDLDYQPWTPGATIGPPPTFLGRPFGESLIAFQDDCIAAKVQAVAAALGPVGEQAQRVANVLRIAHAYAPVTSITRDSIEQRKLVTGWSAQLLAQALGLCGIDAHPIDVFLRDVAWPLLDHDAAGGNWAAAFAGSQHAIAVRLGDPGLWAAAVRYLDQWLPRCIFHRDWDQLTVRTMAGATNTVVHWNGQVDSTFKANASMPSGAGCEDTRDLTHAHLGTAHWVQAIATQRLQGHQVAEHVESRLLLALEREATWARQIINGTAPKAWNGTTVNPGGTGYEMGWLRALQLWGPEVLPSVALLVDQNLSIAVPGVGALGLIGEGLG